MNVKKNVSDQDEDVDILGILLAVLEYKYFIIICTLLFTLSGIVFALLAQPIYKANAVIQVEEKSGSFPGMDELTDVFGAESNAATEIELLKSRRVIGVAADKEMLDVVVEPNYFPIIGNMLNRKNTPIEYVPFISNFKLDEYIAIGESITVVKFSVPESFYGETYKLQIDQNDNYKLYSPEGILKLNCQKKKLCRIDGIEIKIDELNASSGRIFYIKKLRRYNTIKQFQEALTVIEKGKDTGIIELSIEDASPDRAERILNVITNTYVTQNIERQAAEAANSLEFLHQQLPEIKKSLENAERKFNEFQVKAGSVDITVEAESLLNQVVDIESSIATLKLNKAELDRIYTPDHPAYKAWKEQLEALNIRKNELNERVKSLPHTQQELIGYKRDLEVSTEIYTQMIANIQELDIVRAGAVGNVRVIDKAAADIDTPVSPKKRLLIVGAFVIGAFLSVLVVLIRRYFNRGVTNPEELEAIGLPIYASVPLSQAQQKLSRSKSTSRSSNKETYRSALLAEEDATDIAVESLRSLRTSLHFAMLESKNNLIMIGGASPNVGKSFVSANLAAVIAQSGKKVLLVDADMRRGYLHRTFGIGAQNGLSDVLVNRVKISEAIQTTDTENLHVLSRGEIPPNPSELLMSERFTKLMEFLKSSYDHVIVDSPPILAVTDASIIGQLCGVCLLVARYEFTSVKEVQIAKKRFEQNGVPIKGVIFNGIKKSSSKYGYGYGYYNYNYKSANK